MLKSIQFAQSEVAAGEPLILIATPADPSSNVQAVFQLSASSGASRTDTLNVWARMSDQEILNVLAQTGGRVAVGFKESGAERGVSPQGQNLTSAATVQHMREYIVSRGATIVDSGSDLPYVVANVPLSQPLVGSLRQHPNVDYFEPILPGERLGGTTQSANFLVSVTATGPHGATGLQVRSGDTVTAVYRQPDGTTLRTSAGVR
jgi:hypothetical protein